MADSTEDFFYTAAVDADAFWKRVGRAFSDVRRGLGKDEKAIAADGGPDAKTIAKIERGKRGERVHVRTLDAYARALRCPLDVIFKAAIEGISGEALLLALRLEQLSENDRKHLLYSVERWLQFPSPPSES